MKNIIPFTYKNNEIRVTKDEAGLFWWVAKDVCDVLGIRTDTVNAVLDDDEFSNTNTIGIKMEGVNRGLTIINEPGLYSLILKSRKPEAKKFKRWITHEVLPQVRKTGKYEVPSVDLMGKEAKKSNMVHFSVSGLCQEADKFLGGKAALTALNYFTGMPVDDLMLELESKEENKSLPLPQSPNISTSVMEFVTSQCIISSDAEIAKTDLYSGYEDYCKERDIYNVGYDNFFRSLYQLTKVRNVRRRLGNKRIWSLIGIRVNNTHEIEVVS